MVFDDLLTAMENKICILTQSDIPAAFDTIDHQILPARLQTLVCHFCLGFRLIFEQNTCNYHKIIVCSLRMARSVMVFTGALYVSYSTPYLSLTS